MNKEAPALAFCFDGYLSVCYVFRLGVVVTTAAVACGTCLLFPPLVLLMSIFIKCMVYF